MSEAMVKVITCKLMQGQESFKSSSIALIAYEIACAWRLDFHLTGHVHLQWLSGALTQSAGYSTPAISELPFHDMTLRLQVLCHS